MKIIGLLLLAALVSAPVSAYDLAGGAGLSDVAVFTKSQRLLTAHVSVESQRGNIRIGGALTKEGFRQSDGWGLELWGGCRQRLPLNLIGTARAGVMWTMPTISSGRLDYTVDEAGVVQQWRWRTIRSQGPVDSFTLMPFVAYGVRRPLALKQKPLFVEFQLRLAVAPTIDARYQVGGIIRDGIGDGMPFIPGYRIVLGWSF